MHGVDEGGRFWDMYADGSTYKLQLYSAAETRCRCLRVCGPPVASDTRKGEVIGVGLRC
jgi:hypothetical protein